MLCIGLGIFLLTGCTMNGLQKFEAKHYTAQTLFQNIVIEDDTTNINILPSNDGICKIDYMESKQTTYEINVSENTLSIKLIDNTSWYHNLFNFGSISINIYLPQADYQNLTIDTTTGNVNVSQALSFNDVKIDLSTGNASVKSAVSGELSIHTSTGNVTVGNASPTSVTLQTSTGNISATAIHTSGTFYAKSTTGNQSYTDVSCQSSQLQTSTGNIRMVNLVSADHLKASTSTGNIFFDNCDAATLDVDTVTGNVNGTLRTPKIIYATSDTGKISIPHLTEGGLCEITTDTGNIKISIVE